MRKYIHICICVYSCTYSHIYIHVLYICMYTTVSYCNKVHSNILTEYRASPGIYNLWSLDLNDSFLILNSTYLFGSLPLGSAF